MNAGQKIGEEGNTGWSDGVHLHFFVGDSYTVGSSGMPWDSSPVQVEFTNDNTTLYYTDFWQEREITAKYSSASSCSAPSLTEPGDGATLSSRTITFRWNAVSGCTFNGYTFRIKNTSDMDSGGTTLIDTGEGGMQRTETINGWDNQDLYWGVKATNAPNGASWAMRRFRINPQSSSGSWRAEYYDSQDMWWNPNNTNWHSCGEDLSGPTLDKNYGTSAPCSGMRNNGDQWVGDYRGRITFSPGTYVFYSDHDDGARLWVEGLNNNNPIMEAGGSGSTTVCNGPTGYYLDGGKNIRVVLREEGGDARIKLWWDTNTATCLPKCYSLNTSANPSGSGWIGLDPQPNCAGGYTDGTNVQLTASPYSGYTFLNWTGNLTGTANPGSITINDSKTVTANFSGCYMLTRTHSGSGSDPTASPATPPDCSAGQYVAGEAISLTASPANGWRVASWSGTSNNSSTSTSNSLTMPASNHTVGVNYEAIPPTCYTLTRTHTGSGSDPVASPSNSNGCSAGQYVAGASISLTASPASGWRVGSWSGTDNDSSTSTTNSLTMPASNRTVTANYAEIPSGDTTPPNGRITSPSNNATVTACPLQIVAEASDLGSGVAWVRFWANYDGAWHEIVTDNSGTDGWTTSWDCTQVSNQQVTLTTWMEDRAGNQVWDPGGYTNIALDTAILPPCCTLRMYLPFVLRR